MKKPLFKWFCVALSLCLGLAGASAATHTVNVAGLSFSPSVLTVTNGDTVIWNGLASFHTVTPNAGVSEPFCGNTVQASCTITFLSNGSFGYHCNPHQSFGMTGLVNVVSAPGVPPAVSITNPPNNTLFIAPATVVVAVSATDSDGTIANVRLLTNDIAAATNSVAPFGFTLSNLGVGTYTLRARAQDNQSLFTLSAPVNVRVVRQPVLSFQAAPNGPLQFQFSTLPGVDYVVDRATPLTNFSPVVTNRGNGGVIQFSETNGGAPQHTYRVRLQ